MVGDLRLNGDSRMIELAAPPDLEVVAKAQRRKFTAEYKLGIVEEADHASDPGAIRRFAAARGFVFVPPG